MLKFTTKSTIAMSSAYLALSTTQLSPFSPVLTAIGVGFVTALSWDVIGTLVERIGRNDRMVADLSKGVCPNCKGMMTMEVTSEDQRTDEKGFSYQETDITCKRCEADFAIFSSDGGPIVKRVKRC